MKRGAVWLMWLFIAVLSGCTRDTAPDNPCPVCLPSISFKTDIIPILVANCALSGCHDQATDAVHLNFDSAHAYSSATRPGTGYISPYNAYASLFYTILTGSANANHMPLNAPPLPVCETQKIACWINQGALNN